jgi:hypothetical protein
MLESLLIKNNLKCPPFQVWGKETLSFLISEYKVENWGAREFPNQICQKLFFFPIPNNPWKKYYNHMWNRKITPKWYGEILIFIPIGYFIQTICFRIS